MTSGGYSVREARFPADRAAVTGLWRDNLGVPERADVKFEWFYAGSATGAPQTLLLMHAGEEGGRSGDGLPVGVASAGRRPFRLGAHAIDAGVLIDLAVSREHRTLYPALLLQKALLAAGLEARALLYGFPNPKAAAVFQRVGYARIGAMTRFVRVLRFGNYLGARVPRVLAAVVSPVLDVAASWRFDRGGAKWRVRWLEWGQVALAPGPDGAHEGGLLRGARTAEFLRWRFAEQSGGRCTFVSAIASGNESVSGYWVVELLDGILYVRDCSTSLLLDADARGAWVSLFRDARRKGCRAVAFECLAPAAIRRTLISLGMRARGERPVFGVVGADWAAHAASCEWFLTGADEDE